MQFEELVAHVCERPGMYVGEANFRYAAFYLDGCDWGLSAPVREQEAGKDTKTPSELQRFRFWLSVLVFPFDGFSNRPWFVPLLACASDADAFLLLALLFRTYKRHEREAGSAEALAQNLTDLLLSWDEIMVVLDEADEANEQETEYSAPTEAEENAENDAVQAILRRLLDGARQGEEKPLADVIAENRAFYSEQKARAGALLRAAGGTMI